MATLSLTRLAVGICVLALSLTAGGGLASADQDLSPFVNTTCNYGQVISALQAADPEVAAQFASSPDSVSFLRQFLASPPSQRQQMAQMLASQPRADQQFGLVQRVFSTCNNYRADQHGPSTTANLLEFLCLTSSKVSRSSARYATQCSSLQQSARSEG